MSISDMLLQAAYRGNVTAQNVVAELLGTVKLSQITDAQADTVAAIIKPIRKKLVVGCF